MFKKKASLYVCRITTLEQLEREVLALMADRTEKQIKISWQFSLQSARTKLNAHYEKVPSANQKFKTT